jgi:pimeloyl-ACP methyl ester carboxylesterase
VATAADSRAHPAPGRLVDVGGYRLHLLCVGRGTPVVVLDALFPGTVSNWAWVQPRVAGTTQVCAYDRAGLGWSDPGPAPRDAVQQARELHALLTVAGVHGPYVLAGHSLGGLVVRMFADRYPQDVAGVVLVEASDPQAWRRLGRPEGVGVDHTMLLVAPMLGRLGLVRSGILRAPRPDPDLPAGAREELQAFFDSVKYLETLRDADSALPAALAQVATARALGSTPLAVVVGTLGDGGDPVLRDLFVRQAALSTDSVTQVVDGATHAGLVDEAKSATATALAIRRVVCAVRVAQPVATASERC